MDFIINLEGSAKKPLGVFVHRIDGESLSCVLGASLTAFVWYPQNYDENAIGSWTSHTNTPAEEPLDFWLCGHHTQAYTDSQVPRSVLQKVILSFLKNGERNDSIKWIRD